MTWPFMVAFFATFNAFIFTMPLTTVNQSPGTGNVSYGWWLKEIFPHALAITLSLLLSLLLGAMLSHTDPCIDKKQLLSCLEKSKEQISILLMFPFIICPFFKFYVVTQDSCQFFFTSQVGLTCRREVEWNSKARGRALESRNCPHLQNTHAKTPCSKTWCTSVLESKAGIVHTPWDADSVSLVFSLGLLATGLVG